MRGDRTGKLNIWLNRPQFLHRMLRRLRFHFSRRWNPRHQSYVHIQHIPDAHILAELVLPKRQRFNIYPTTNFSNYHIWISIFLQPAGCAL